MTALLWITKTAESKSLSHSEGQEQIDILSQAQTVSRRRKVDSKRKRGPKSWVSRREILVTRRQECSGDHCVHENLDFCQQNRKNKCAISHCVCNEVRSTRDTDHLLSLCNHPLERNYDWTLAERRSAAYFQEVTVYKILTLRHQKDFWKGIVPCIAELDSGIRHLMVAIAATYELLTKPNSSSLNDFALTQCNKALRAIISPERKMSQCTLITSCILVAAYNLLRCDADAADRSIESGLQLLSQTQSIASDTDIRHLSHILTSLGGQHGFKLWAADVTYVIDRTVVGLEDLSIHVDLPKGPFVDVSQVLTAFKTLMLEFMAKPMRNTALGAHIDPNSLFAKDLCQNFSQILFYWESFYHSLPEELSDERLQLKQLKIGLLLARLLFHTKVLASNELETDLYTVVFTEILQLGQEVIAARHDGRPVIYLDRIVNGALFTSAMFCRDPFVRRELVSLLKGQVGYADGLVNFLRGRVAEIVVEIEEHGLVAESCHDIPEAKRVAIAALHCQQDRILRSGIMKATQTNRSNPEWHFSRVPPELDRFDSQEIDDCLQGIIAAYKMYRKQDLCLAPNGYLRKMYYGTSPVNIKWRADLVAEHES